MPRRAARRAARTLPIAVAVVTIGTLALLRLGGSPTAADPADPLPGADIRGGVTLGGPHARDRVDAAARRSLAAEASRGSDGRPEVNPRDEVPDAHATAAASSAADEILAEWSAQFAAGLQGGSLGGIGVYPPRGTNPPKPGIVVPDDFQLPDGYVRHYQVTDDGQRLEPILMYSPDHRPHQSDGASIEPSADGVVPPELAPPGLPVRMLVVPPDPAARPTR